MIENNSKSSVERSIENEMNAIAAKNRDALNSALIQPLSPEWQFCTNGLYLLLATAGCGKSRFIIKHILMSERYLLLFNKWRAGQDGEHVHQQQSDQDAIGASQ